ncbi:MAG: AAA family ATPase [Bacteroidetes bacterium]|nr:AAA family ATPase [Bacteroidota bacterium]
METIPMRISDKTLINCDLERTTSKMSLGEVFSERKGCYLNEFNLFLAHFNCIPNFIHEVNIDCKRAKSWFSEKYKPEIRHHYFDKRYYNRSKNPEYDDVFYILYDDLIVYMDTNQSVVRFLFQHTDIKKVEEVIQGVRKFREKKARSKPEIALLVNSRFGLDAKELAIIKPKLNIEENYNDDFIEVHQTILKRLSKKNDKGIVLLLGKNGTGKTFYIRYLISKINKKVIFLPPNMAKIITNPDLISVLIDNPNSVFVIEDAENIVVDREKDGQSPVTALLNISDGLLSDCLNIQIICSFNTDLSRVDTALLRKGRLIAKYEFKELAVEKAQLLSKKLGFSGNISSPITLTGIYNQGEKEFSQMKKRNLIGFKS